MPALFPRFFRTARRLLAAAVRVIASCAGALSFSAAADVLVVTDNHHPVQAPDGVRVIELDAPARIEAELAANLPADPAEAAAVVQRRLNAGSTALHQRIRAAHQGVADAWRLGVTTLPAVVVDRRYVIYGEPDVAEAIARIETYRKAQQ